MNNCDAYSPSSPSPSSTSTSTSPRGRALVQMFEIVTASNWTGSYQKQKNNSNSNSKLSNSKSSNKNRNRIVSDLRPLLLLMDIGSCASAEKHCKVNCVTASMGDVVIENYPIVGDLLELQASPVSVGRTSLEISVLIIAHSNSDSDSDSDSEDSSDSNDEEHDGEDAKDNDEHSNGSPSSFVQTKTTRRVCEAFFTYVTTRGPNGEKRYVPPLEEEEKTNGNVVTVSSSSSTIQQQQIYICKLKWERTLAYFRKELIKSEQQLVKTFNSTSTSTSTSTSNCQSNTPTDIFEMSEVVLPSNQNHMKHLFGGVVMGWMCKSVVAGCVKATCLSANKFHITAIHRVDFPTGAEVSDHVFFRPRITAIFEQGRSAEFEVKVGKRNITPMIHGQSNNNGADDVYDDHDETLMNIGHFYVSGSLSYVDDEDKKKKKKKKLSSSIAPFAKLLNTHTHKHLYSNDSIHNRIERNMAYQRRKSLLARRHLLAGLGESLQWDSSCLKIQAPILTILSVLRLCDEYESTNANSSSADDDDANGDALYYQKEGRVWKDVDLEGSLSYDPDHVIEWTPGNVDTVLLRGKTVISRKRSCQNKNDIVDESESEKSSSSSSSSSLSASSSFLEAVYTTLRDKRLQWDPACMSVTLLEDNRNDDDDENDEVDDDEKTKRGGSSVLKPDWDIVEYKMQTPNAKTKFCLLRVGAYVKDDNSVSNSNSRNNNNNKVTSGVLASRSVIHDKSDAKNRVLPSGWLLKMIDNNNNCCNDDNIDDEFIEITYIAEQDFAKIRDTGVGGNKDVTDEHLAKLYGSYVSQWFTNLASFDHTSPL